MNSKLKRILCFVLALLTVLSMALPTLAITTTITDEDIPYDFFEYSCCFAHKMRNFCAQIDSNFARKLIVTFFK